MKLCDFGLSRFMPPDGCRMSPVFKLDRSLSQPHKQPSQQHQQQHHHHQQQQQQVRSEAGGVDGEGGFYSYCDSRSIAAPVSPSPQQRQSLADSHNTDYTTQEEETHQEEGEGVLGGEEGEEEGEEEDVVVGEDSLRMTQHVVTRWYRAPELILLEPYSLGVDVVSLTYYLNFNHSYSFLYRNLLCLSNICN